MNARTLAVGTFVPMLQNLLHVLDKGAASERTAGLPQARLAPDMYPLQSQVQLACFHADDARARLLGETPITPDMADESIPKLKERVERTIATLDKAGELDGERAIVMPLPDGASVFEMTGAEFLQDWAIPHFYLHVVTAYDILRHHGVPLGKRDYLQSVARHLREPRSPDS